MYSCPGEAPKSQYQAVRNTLEVISGKWKLFLLAALLTRPFRFRELSREVGITPRLLAKELQELQELEQHQLVSCTVCDTRPITFEYAPQPDAAAGGAGLE